jgi:hypothetical protein
MHNHVARDYHLELVVRYDLRLGMIVAEVHVLFCRCVLAILDVDASTGKGGARRSEG